jgi:ribosome-associated translation inhibitor RaiA
MKNNVQVKVKGDEFKETHEKQFSTILSRVQEIVPGSSKVEGRIVGTGGKYEGHIRIRSHIGTYIAKAKSTNLFSLIAKLQSKTLRQVVNWREKKASKKRYHRRKQKLEQVTDGELA